MIEVKPATLAWTEALIEGDRVFTERCGIPVVPRWASELAGHKWPEELGHVLGPLGRIDVIP